MATSTPELVRTMICCAGDRLVVPLLHFVADQRAANGAGHHGHIAAGAAADQAADAHARQAAQHGAHAGLLGAGDLRRGDLLDHAAANFLRRGRGRCGTCRQDEGQGGGTEAGGRVGSAWVFPLE